MDADVIKQYLKNHPEFFEQNAAFLADIHLPSPHGSGTISLAERQQLAQRDKINALEERFAELVLNAQENEKIMVHMHQFTLKLQQTKHFDAIEQLISHFLPEHFNISDTYLRVWAEPTDDVENLVFSAEPQAVQDWVKQIHNVYCGPVPATIDTDNWFIEPAASIAVLPLKNGSAFGFLALASDHAERFYVGMGTDFLQKLADHISAAMSRYVALRPE